MLRDVIDHVRQDLDRVNEPRVQALLETTAEVLTGLQTNFHPLQPRQREGLETPGGGLYRRAG